MRIKKEIVSLLSLGIFFGFMVGSIVGINSIMANSYPSYTMLRSMAQHLQQAWNQWIPLILAVSVILLVVIFLAPVLFKTLAKTNSRHLIDIHVKDQEKTKTLLITLTICLILFLSGGWAINRYWLPGRFHPVSLLGDVAILAFTILLGWVLFKTLWKSVYPKIAAGILILLIIWNAGIFLDQRINTPDGPNVILIIVDTLRADRLSSNGYFREISPHIDNFSSTSIHFKKAISSAPWTTPSIASIFTSRYPAQLGFGYDPVVIDKSAVTLAEIFQENNYLTKGIISHTLVSARLGLDQGFDDYDEENAQGHGHVSSASIIQKAVTFLKKNKDRKFFLFLHFFDPHFDYILHEKYDYFPDYEGPLYSGQPIRKLLEKAPSMTPEDVRYVEALYDSEISFTDEYIGNFLADVTALGLDDKTLMVFTADHGEEFLERGDFWIGHDRKLYQEQIHVPLMIRLPENNKGQTVDEYVGLIDLMPTVLHYAGLDTPEQYRHEGKVLDLNNREELDNRIIISETRRDASLLSVIWKGWKLINDPEMKSTRLFDLTSDPWEFNNVSSQNETMLKTLKEMLQEWIDAIETERPHIKAEEPRFTEEQKEKLRSLGYIK